MVSQGTQLPSNVPPSLQLPAVEGKNSEAENGRYAVEGVPGQSIHEVRQELLSLSLRHAEVQKRIRCLRNALVALMKVFGPQLLARQRQEFREQGSMDVQPGIVALCREVLRTSRRWLTLREILDAIRNHSPHILASFKNPGVSVSNVLRSLRRQREVELELDAAGSRWRWVKGESQSQPLLAENRLLDQNA